MVRACHYTVALDGVKASSYNVSVAGSIIMYDRMSKERAGHGGAGGGGGGGAGGSSRDSKRGNPAIQSGGSGKYIGGSNGNGGSSSGELGAAASGAVVEVGHRFGWALQAVGARRERLLIPTAAMTSAAGTPLPPAVSADGAPIIAFFPTEEALSWRPWPAPPHSGADKEHGMAKKNGSDGMDEQQRRAHRRAVAAQNPVRSEGRDDGAAAAEANHNGDDDAVLGYATWVSAAALRVSTPLLLRELSTHIGTRIWSASWLHRAWALANPQLFPPGSHVLELGAGVGLLGLSIAAVHAAVRVTLSDYHGQAEGNPLGSVMHNLRHNARRNAAAIGDDADGSADGSPSERVRVVELDWTRPDAARLWFPQEESAVPSPSEPSFSDPRTLPPLCLLDPADVVLGTECVYTEDGMRALCATLAATLRRPSGACYLLNNSRRTAAATFEAECRLHGLTSEVLSGLDENVEAVGGAMSTFAPPWDECDDYTMLKVTWGR